jgi:lysine 2,3-aminomutase
VLRNYEGVITTYQEPDSYEQKFCDRKCANCDLQLMLDEGIESGVSGIEMLLADSDATISLTPQENQRMERRDEV